MASRTRPLLLFAPGAGAPSSHPWMRHWGALLETLGTVRGFDYAYMAEGRKRPDPLPQLVATHRAALAAARRDRRGPVFLIGKSMGGRVGCHAALEDTVAGVVCLGYPLCAGGDCTKMRDKVLCELTTPVLFVQGTRDAFCPLETLAEVRGRMQSHSELYVVEGGDHSLAVTKRQLTSSGDTQELVEARVLAVIKAFLLTAQ